MSTQILYSLHFKSKVTFVHKLHYEIKVTFGEISLKLCQTNWNVARNNANVVVDELPSQITIYTCLNIVGSTASMHINAVLCASVPSFKNGSGLSVQLAPKVFDFIMDTPSSLKSA